MEVFNISTAKFSELRAYCKKNNIEFNRTDSKDELIDKISSFCAEELTEPESLGEESLVIGPDNLDKELKDLGINKEVFIPKPVTTPDHYTTDEVIERCNILFAGRAIAKYNKENPEAIEFHGGPRQRQDVSINQPLNAILGFAKNFCAKAYIDKSHVGSGESLSLAGVDVESLTPAQQLQLKENLNKILQAV